IITVVDLGAFELEIRVPDSVARDLALGMPAEIRAGTQGFPGKVRSVSPEVVEGNVATRLEFVDQRPAGLRQNQRLTARILIEIITVVDLGAFELEIRVPDSVARDLALGMPAEIRAGTQGFPGKVRSVSPEVVEGNVATRLEFVDQRPAGLRQNQRLTARILI